MLKVYNFNELQQALYEGATHIGIARSFLALTPILLPQGVVLEGLAQEDGSLPLLSFLGDGVSVSKNNRIENLNISAPSNHKAIFHTQMGNEMADLGEFKFANLSLTGQFSFIMRAGIESASVWVENLDIIACDSRHYFEQPQKYGVNVLQGAFTVYNFNSDAKSLLKLHATGIRIGRKNAPVSGSGLFVSGFGDEGGRLHADLIETKAIYSNGKLPFGVANLITAAVFVVYGAHVERLEHTDEIVTYGVNDMVLDTWGQVDDWLSHSDVISYGPSGVGFVNFGYVKNFVVKGAVKTYGLGARGYNQYDGTVDNIEFNDIATYGDGSVGVQISKKIGTLTVKGSISTQGGIGNSLVKGKNVMLPAIALSIKEGGEVDNITVQGNISTEGKDVAAYQVDAGGIVHAMHVGGQIHAKAGSAIVVHEQGVSPIR